MFVKLPSLRAPISMKDKVEHLLRSLPDSLPHIASLGAHLELSYDQIGTSVRSEIDRKLSNGIKQDQSRGMPLPGARVAHDRSMTEKECYYCHEKRSLSVNLQKEAEGLRKNGSGHLRGFSVCEEATNQAEEDTVVGVVTKIEPWTMRINTIHDQFLTALLRN